MKKYWGKQRDDMKLPFKEQTTYGRPSVVETPVKEIVQPKEVSDLLAVSNEAKEAFYPSKIREPLGKTSQLQTSRSYVWPKHTRNGTITFGQSTQGLENAKDILYPQTARSSLDEEITTQLYKKSHNRYAPGEQRRRNYSWNIAPDKLHHHLFGMPDKKIPNAAGKALFPERQNEDYPKTKIVKKVIEDFRNVNYDHLGQSRNHGQCQTERGPHYTHGIKTNIKADENI